ncbi:MAG: S1C family serine protease [Spirochaetaceae bacterium]|nr:S1C family serine protease [Spirochaetaceae bacterium]
MFAACNSYQEAEKRLTPPKSTQAVRYADIVNVVEDDPAAAIHLIGIYQAIYGDDIQAGAAVVDQAGAAASAGKGAVGEGAVEGSAMKEGAGTLVSLENPAPAEKSAEKAASLDELKKRAGDRLKTLQEQAITEKRWDDAASLARSLAAIGVSVKNTGAEPDFLLEQAKDYLQKGNNLPAFLYAFRAHELSRISGGDALLFLERAVTQKQRGTAAYFLAAARSARANIPPDFAEFAERKDTPDLMIKGVATVVVDRGMKIERGRGTPDRVLGSAFFVDSSGLLITNYHVIASEVDPSYNGYSRMYVRTGDSSSARVPAKVIGWDKTLDLALIKTEIKPEYVFSIIDHATPAVGETVIAIGSPGGLEKTVTSGIVSALGRRFLQIGDVIQMDAAVNHGNSGGPLVDTRGRLVGIVFAGIEQFQGLNFAVPAVRLTAALPALIKGGKAARPWLGITIAETRGSGEIIYVAPQTPASDQMLREGLTIEALDGQKVGARQGALIPTLQDKLFPCRPGELVALRTSDGKTRIMRTAERPPVPLAEAAKVDSRERMTAPLFGLVLEPSVGDAMSPSYLIKKVVRGSIADEAGLSAQDPVSIRRFRVEEKDGYALLEINVKKKRAGYFETSMSIPAALDSPDTL